MDGFYTEQELRAMGFKSLGEDVKISNKASIYGADKMSFGSHIRIDDFCMLVGNITVGSYVHIGPNCGLHASRDAAIIMEDFTGMSSGCTAYAASDDYSGKYLTNPTVPEKYINITTSTILYEKHSLTGVGCTLLPGAILREGAAVGAMGLIYSELPPWSICMGIPARKVQDRDRTALALEKEFMEELHRTAADNG